MKMSTEYLVGFSS